MRKLILSILIILFISTLAYAQYHNDIIVTSPDGIWVDARAYSTLNLAVAAVGANERTIKIVEPEIVSSLTIPSNITLNFERDGSIANTGQLTINTTKIKSPNKQIFTGVGNIDFADGTILKSSYFANIESAFALTTNDTVTLIVSKPQSITASYSPGDDVQLKWESPGNILSINAGVVLDNLGIIDAGKYQIFAGAGTIAGLREVYPEWLGAVGDGSVDDTAELQASWDIVRVSGGLVVCTQTYLTSSNITGVGVANAHFLITGEVTGPFFDTQRSVYGDAVIPMKYTRKSMFTGVHGVQDTFEVGNIWARGSGNSEFYGSQIRITPEHGLDSERLADNGGVEIAKGDATDAELREVQYREGGVAQEFIINRGSSGHYLVGISFRRDWDFTTAAEIDAPDFGGDNTGTLLNWYLGHGSASQWGGTRPTDSFVLGHENVVGNENSVVLKIESPAYGTAASPDYTYTEGKFLDVTWRSKSQDHRFDFDDAALHNPFTLRIESGSSHNVSTPILRVINEDVDTDIYSGGSVFSINADTGIPSLPGGMQIKFATGEKAITADASITLDTNVNGIVKLIGCAMRVDVALAGGETWDAEYSVGAQAITSNAAVAKDTKVYTMYDTNANTDVFTSGVDITITKNGGGAFTAQGTITSFVWYYQMGTLPNAP